jgi:hypothetical protein
MFNSRLQSIIPFRWFSLQAVSLSQYHFSLSPIGQKNVAIAPSKKNKPAVNLLKGLGVEERRRNAFPIGHVCIHLSVSFVIRSVVSVFFFIVSG